MARKRTPLPPGLGQGSGYYTREIVKRLEQAYRCPVQHKRRKAQ